MVTTLALSSIMHCGEVKLKNNKGRTIKSRQPSRGIEGGFEAGEKLFLSEKSPYECDQLRAVLQSEFRRLMLVSRQMDERCTIDSDIRFVCGQNRVNLESLIIVEVKTQGRSRTPMIEALRRRRIKPSGFSKYCIGRSLADEGVKHNNFKEMHREITKKIDNQINTTTI